MVEQMDSSTMVAPKGLGTAGAALRVVRGGAGDVGRAARGGTQAVERRGMGLEGYYTTTEAAGLLGLKAPTVRDAVRRGRLTVEWVGGRNLVTVTEIERYRAEVLGTRV